MEEWQRLLQVLYSDGGMFAKGCTYSEFLANRFDPRSENGRAAHFEELAECGARSMPRTQEEMCQLLEGETCEKPQQMDFTL